MGRKTKNVSRPPFVVSDKSLLRDTGRQVDWSAFTTNQYRHGSFAVVVGAAGAAGGAVAVPVAALKEALTKGTVLNFGANKFATLNADAAVGATSLTTLAIPTALVSGDTAYATNSVLQGFFVRAGTIVDLLANGKVVPAAFNTAAVTAYGILETNAEQNAESDALSGYGCLIAGDIYENLLPEADLTLTPPTVTAAWKTELAARSGRFQFHQYTDTTS